MLYRTLDSDANVASEQRIKIAYDDYTHFKVLRIADCELHYFALGDGFAYVGSLTFDGTQSEVKSPTGIDEMYNIFNPVKINNRTFAVNFNWETGNGWAIIQDDTLKNFFVEKETGYQCWVTGETLPLPKDLILSAISAPDENTYSIAFYPNTETKQEIYILNKPIS